jgi:hypothetical protein
MAGHRRQVEPKELRCYTRTLKNARYLQEHAPDVFAKEPEAEGFGTGVPTEILRGLHRLRPDSPVLNRHKKVAEVLREHPVPSPGRQARDALFSGTIHFARITFQTSAGNQVIPTADMNQIVQYTQHAIVSISEYGAQYGPNSLAVSSTLLTKTVNVPSGSYSDSDLQGWVNALASDNSLPSNSCIFVISPQGVSAPNVGGNSGYHGKANIPYVVAGVDATGLTLADQPDVYAMVVSHEIAELVVDPNVDGANPEVCDPCDINCSNLTRCYFDASDNFLGSNQDSPPGGFTFSYYTCAVVKPAGASDCPASSDNCAYAPVLQDCQLIIDKSTFGSDEIAVQLPGMASYPAAYWVAVDGFTGAELGFNAASDLANPAPSPAPTVSVSIDAALNPSLTAAQISTIAANLPSVNQLGPLPVVATDPTLAPLTQRFLYPYTIAFGSSAAFDTLLLDQAATLTLTATFTVGSVTRTDSAPLELVKGENPFLTNVNPADPSQPVWLSFDLRFFKVVVPSGGSASRFGATMSSDPADAPGFIASAIGNLTANGGVVAGDAFADLSQGEATSALEFLRQDSTGDYVFNFAVARVRLLGKTAGAQAQSVRVFFRLFQAQTTASTFNESTTYRFASDGVLNGHKISLLGIQNDAGGTPEYVTVPCFASPRVNLSSPAGMDTQTDPPNVQTIVVNPGIEVDTYFGCWLDLNQPQQNLFPQTPPAGNFDGPWSGISLQSLNQVITRSPHQCLITEIRYDDAPIPAGANAGTSDKLAQRNIAWIDGPNPGASDSRQMPHPFEIKPSAAADALDELMILWGNTPKASSASFYLPTLSAAEIVGLADGLYGRHRLRVEDTHTIRCPAEGVTFIPIPAGTARTAGLLTVELPAGVRKGDSYTIAVRQVTQARFTPPPPPPVIGRAERPHGKKSAQKKASEELVWRRVEGAFLVTLVISTREELLEREERLLAWLRWIIQTMPHGSRWHPVWQRYLEVIARRVFGFGGDPAKIVPSPTGTVPHHHKPVHGGPLEEHRREFTGKVVGLIHDRFGDFDGFLLHSEHGDEESFRSREHAIERLAVQAWAERAVISVFCEQRRPHVPSEIIVRRAPEPFQH